jgi:hypothetical protein
MATSGVAQVVRDVGDQLATGLPVIGIESPFALPMCARDEDVTCR